VSNRYSNFDLIAEAVHKFILKKNTVQTKKKVERSCLEEQVANLVVKDKDNKQKEKRLKKGRIKQNLNESIESVNNKEKIKDLKENLKEGTEIDDKEVLDDSEEDPLDDSDTLEDDDNKTDHIEPIITYLSSEEEQFLAENFYKTGIVDYDELFNYNPNSVDYTIGIKGLEVNSSISNTNSETMTAEEAEETLIEIQYATVLGTINEISHEKRRKFSTWVTFNSALMSLFHSLYAVTGDVDYSKTF